MSEYLGDREKIEPPPEGLGPDDLASQLLLHMGVGRSQPNMLAASEALRLKGSQPKFTVSRAYVFIARMWQEYKRSPRYASEFRRKASDWLSEADYDNPPSWGGSSLIQREPKPAAQLEGVALWKRDKELHPEKYATADETRDFLKKMGEILERKRMPETGTSALKQKAGSNSTTVGSRHSLEIPENNGPQQ